MKSRQEKVESKRSVLESQPQNYNANLAKWMQQPFKKSLELADALGGEFSWRCIAPEFNFSYYSTDPANIVKRLHDQPRFVIIDSPERDFLADLLNSPKMAFPPVREYTENWTRDYNDYDTVK